VEDIHALQGMVAMAPKKIYIQGGVSQIAEQFLNHSDARVFLNTAVRLLSHVIQQMLIFKRLMIFDPSQHHLGAGLYIAI
jgi:hypothetical protein